MTFVRNVISKILLPNFERDLTKTISREVSKVHSMTDCMIAPTAYAFEANGAQRVFTATAKRDFRLTRVEYPVPGQGLFH